MFTFNDPETFWLNVTNLVLGLVTFVCCAVIGRGVFKELRERVSKPALVPAAGDDHAFVEPRLGVIMADGGEKVVKHPAPAASMQDKGSEANTIRSEN